MELDKKKRIAIVTGAAALLILFVTGINLIGRHSKDSASKTEIEVPEAECTKMTESKTQAYESGNAKINSHWDSCEEDIYGTSSEADSKEDTKSQSPRSEADTSPKSKEDLFGKGQRETNSVGSSGQNPYRETPQQREERHRRRQEEAIELAERMQNGEDRQDSSTLKKRPAEDKQQVMSSPPARRAGIISSFDDTEGDGISTFDEQHDKEPNPQEKLFKCMFARESKVRSGDRVAVIINEEIVVGNVRIPKNTHMMATCQISSRLMMEITSIEMNGRLIDLGYEAYDTDGGKGIHCPDVGSSGKTIRNRGSSIAGNSLTRRMGNVAKEVVSTGITLFQNSQGETTVTIPSGYPFFIKKKTQH